VAEEEVIYIHLFIPGPGYGNMFNAAHSFRRLSCLALLCACAILLAWAAPAIAAVTNDSLGFLMVSQGRPISDLAVEQSETADFTDDPVLLFHNGCPDLHALTFLLHAAHLTEQIWSPAPPVRPPIVHA
jgi:hypothetical protein